ncbi:hypothetical protein SS50377_20627 [Spironucleus salmonicida]|uniref:Uncharacterized protein n=1 Tax=Spironucleus salmonicida TaxID=348837 RepID=A0A9P8LZJ4_9EUKA|nr:hypothetical protein SS50377_20627 [Spironucleus salmonicida]
MIVCPGNIPETQAGKVILRRLHNCDGSHHLSVLSTSAPKNISVLIAQLNYCEFNKILLLYQVEVFIVNLSRLNKSYLVNQAPLHFRKWAILKTFQKLLFSSSLSRNPICIARILPFANLVSARSTDPGCAWTIPGDPQFDSQLNSGADYPRLPIQWKPVHILQWRLPSETALLPAHAACGA